MGMIISGSDAATNSGIVPVTLTLECDSAAEFFCRGFEKFEHPDGFIGCHAAAMTAGWLERHSPTGRLWLCPSCSKKNV